MTMPENSQPARTPLIAGNWKMNLDHIEAVRLLDALTSSLPTPAHGRVSADIVVFPPFTDLRDVQTLTVRETMPFFYGAQDLSEHDAGAYTGDISGAFLAKLGCTHVLVGHSERRTIHQEDERLVAAKTQAAYRHGLVPVVCVGEGLEIRQAGTHVEHTLAQLRGALEGLRSEHAQHVVIAYEPVWAIGTGEVAGPEDAQEMCEALRTEIGKILGPQAAASARILYGGSVKAANAAEILACDDVDGVLVGGASLDAREFAAIAQAATAGRAVGTAGHTVS